jgi:hypothetical protein
MARQRKLLDIDPKARAQRVRLGQVGDDAGHHAIHTLERHRQALGQRRVNGGQPGHGARAGRGQHKPDELPPKPAGERAGDGQRGQKYRPPGGRQGRYRQREAEPDAVGQRKPRDTPRHDQATPPRAGSPPTPPRKTRSEVRP